ncbi:hypothetical protein B296_00046828 [Ensete ventricosum]|uniref:Uncharacterized protein n=1 Tax=Ensete ventricosum TaxID=4639 RepID=A0A426YDE3_ENSVE|nr:hypothetical protein B296_00046828 [Ensete ventricosum]
MVNIRGYRSVHLCNDRNLGCIDRCASVTIGFQPLPPSTDPVSPDTGIKHWYHPQEDDLRTDILSNWYIPFVLDGTHQN